MRVESGNSVPESVSKRLGWILGAKVRIDIRTLMEDAESSWSGNNGIFDTIENMPKAIIDLMEGVGLVTRSTTSMGGVVATELKFAPQATEFIVKYFKPAQ